MALYPFRRCYMGLRQTFAILVIAMLVCSCALEPSTSEKVPDFESIAFVTPDNLPKITLTESESAAFGKQLQAGAALGTVGGAAVGAATCGPVFYGPCLAIMSWYGLVAGTTGGAILGLYSYTGLSDTDTAYITEVLSKIDANRNFHQDLSKRVEQAIPAELIATPEVADVQVVVRVSRIAFTEVERELVITQLHGTMVIAWAQDPGESTYRELFAAETPARDIDELIANDGRLLESAIDECLMQLAEQMSLSLIRLEHLAMRGEDP